MLQMINEAKDTALHEAVRYNHIDVVKVLTVEDHELPYDANNAGKTPLYLAAERGYAEVLQEILHTCISPADHGPCSRTALHATVIRNDIGKLISLSSSFIEISILKIVFCFSMCANEPPHFAARFGYIEIAEMLLIKERSTAYKGDIDGDTALHVAAAHGRVDIIGRRALYNDIYGDRKENKSNPTESSTSKDGNGNANDRSSRDDTVEKARQNNVLVAANS
ncbi:hypothetical protein LWI28_012313 [Acer negundo]|uniref:Uncharacterized protein n=1 Tax=Acer negundo TaxID=4023 RepID=A0AAD5P0A0_ACENE|nr:hypothetical protein LWI28_012313 [Acer negundo]KAK4856204.1 hypothetical protein QYF36_015148 [Acer negundo]